MNRDFVPREDVSCIVCGGNDAGILYKENISPDINVTLQERFKSTNSITLAHTGQVVKCKKCGLVYVAPRSDSDDIIRTAYKSVEDILYLKNRTGKLITFNKVMDLIEKHRPKGRILDVGCYYGFLLYAAKKRNWEIDGVELSYQAVKYAKDTFNVDAFNGTLKEADFPYESFDAVTMLAVIEHLPDPRVELNEIKRILKKNGILVIATHNIDSILARIMGRYYPWLCEMHLYHFSPKTLEKLLWNNGFKVIKNYSYGQTYNLGYVSQRIGANSLFFKIAGKILDIPVISKLNVVIDTKDAFLTIAKKI